MKENALRPVRKEMLSVWWQERRRARRSGNQHRAHVNDATALRPEHKQQDHGDHAKDRVCPDAKKT